MSVPDALTLPNHDPGRDQALGLVLEKGGVGLAETDPDRYQQWVSGPGGMTVDGDLSLVFWAAMADFETGGRGIVEAYLLDCLLDGSSCAVIAQGVKDIADWSGGWAGWGEHSVEFGRLVYTVPLGHTLSIKIVVLNDADDDMWFAYGAQDFPSRLRSGAPSDIVLDCAFSDWFNGSGTEVLLVDEGGANDWASLARLDITQFGISSNLTDSLHLLMGFDDTSLQGATAAILMDTDFNNLADYAVVATIDGASAAMELYACDNTLADGCGQAYFYVVEREGGLPVRLSAQHGPSDDSARIGFDDDDPLSAPADAFLSLVGAKSLIVPGGRLLPRGGDGRPQSARPKFVEPCCQRQP